MSATVDLVFPGDSELAALMRRHGWSATVLGPVESWPSELRSAVRMILTSRFSMWMGWGDDLTFFYNDAYRRDTLGTKHPRALGLATREVWSEIWADIGPRIAGVLADGRATWDEGLLLMLERNGYPEETYHTFSYSPLHDDAGQVRGLLCVVNEETGRVISERRVALLGKLASEIAGSSTDDGVLAALRRVLEGEARDLPFTLTYTFDDKATARLVSQSGFAGTPPVATTIAVDAGRAWPGRELLMSDVPTLVELPDAAWPAGPWQLRPTHALVVPLAQQGHQHSAGVFIAGLNPHRAVDAPYREFVTLLVGQIAAGLANARAYDHERRRAESLAELDRAKTAFFSNVSHEFRTPLTLMLGPIGALLDDPELSSLQRHELETLQRNGLRLLKLVNTMLDFSRLEAGRETVHLEPVDIGAATADLASGFRAAIEKAGLRFAVDAPTGMTALVDLDMWEKIVLNLLSNALKFTFDGEIAVSIGQRGDAIDLVVRDTGTGIPASQLAHVFDRFHRVEGAKGRTHEGTGIGLALVQELVRLHRGTIAVTSEPDRGSTFTVSVPVATSIAGAVDRPAAPRRTQTSAFTEEAMRWLPGTATELPGGAPASRQRVLVADDNADMRDYMRRLLGARWVVDTAANGREALDAIARHRPDLVITDVMMPELDGFGLVAAIRADPALRDLPVVMLSARAGEEARIEGLQAGATDYIVKPFGARELLARLDAQLLSAAVRSAEQHQWRRLATIFEQAPVAIAILNGPEHVFEIANAQYRRIIGGRDVMGLTVAAGLPEVVGQGLIDVLDGVYATGTPFAGSSVAIQLRPAVDAPLEDRYFDLVYQPIVDGTGAVVGIAAIGHDVTALAIARREAETANRTKDEFLAMLGHELRNPLAPILTALQLMRLRATGDGERERLVIERQVQHLVGLVDDLLDVSRITRGKVELRMESVEIADVVARSIEVASPLLEQQRHTLTVDAPRGLHVRGDASRIAQILSNLLTNAAKYTSSGGRIHVRATHAPGSVTISVRDNGIGIEPAMLPRVFEPFTQSRQAIDRARGGLGLGLAIVDNLTRAHGGTVTAASDGPGHGSEFTVSLPAIDAPEAAPAPEVRTGSDARSGDARILIVDDNVDAAQLLADILGAGGYHTVAAHDGPSALVLAAELLPQVAVLDLGLPVMDGFELARHFREHPALRATHLVAVTGYGQAEDRARTSAAGFAAHLVKPVDIKQLRATIARLLATAA